MFGLTPMKSQELPCATEIDSLLLCTLEVDSICEGELVQKHICKVAISEILRIFLFFCIL